MKKDDYIESLVKKLPMLRIANKLTQQQLGEKLGISRQTIVSIETGKRPMSWSLYLAIVFVFQQYEETKMLLESFELFDAEYIRRL